MDQAQAAGMNVAVPVTVAIAACDRPAGVLRCLDGLLSGAVLPAEVLVVDQSRDGAVEAAVTARPAGRVPVRHLRMPRRGLSASRNVAFAAAAQPVIAFTDDDCVPAADWVETVHQALVGDRVLAAVTGRVLPLGKEREGTYVVSPRTSTEPREYRGRAVPWTVGTGGNCAARREWLERVRGFDERLGAGSPGRAAEDADFLYRLLRAGARVRYEPASVVYHERQTAEQRLASRRGYGHGIGALCALYLRQGDLFAGRMLGVYLTDHLRHLTKGCLRRDWFAVRQRVLAIQGCATGLVYGLRVP